MKSDTAAIQVVESVCGSLSAVACIIMLVKLSAQKSKNFTGPLLIALFSFILVLSIMQTIGRAAFGSVGFCAFQGFMIEWMYLCIMFWDMLMSYLMYTWIVKKQHPKRMDKLIRKNLIAVVVVALIISIIVIGTDSISSTYIWCWISRSNPVARFLGFEIFLILAWFSNCAMLLSVQASLQSRMKRATFHEKIATLMDSSKDGSIQTKLIVYLVIFSIVWFFFLLNRLVETVTNSTNFSTSILQAFFVSLQGFLYAFVYGGIIKGRLWRISKKKSTNFFLKDQQLPDSGYREEMVEATPQTMTGVVKSSKHFVPKKYSIFSSTFNMGEAPLSKMEQHIKDWILEGHDVYAIGVQECMDLASVRVAIQKHLGGPDKYQMYGIAIGSDTKSLGFHGYIALTVLVKTSEIQEGNIQVTIPAKGAMATGADLIVTTAQNKGAVGIPLQIHDTSIGFVTCHLPSDSKGKSKLIKRNASAHAILKEVTLAPEDLGFDLHLQHDHVLVFGDLNYRMDTDGDGGGVNSLTGVTVACGVEKQGYNDDFHWISRKFNLLRHHSDPLYPTIQEIKLIQTAKSQAYGAWKSVLRADELRSIMDDGDAFFGFEEPMPAFPPSYKRRKYSDADCGDYTNFDTVIKGYSNTGYVENLLADAAVLRQKKSASSKIMKGFNKHFNKGKRTQPPQSSASASGDGLLTASALATLSSSSSNSNNYNSNTHSNGEEGDTASSNEDDNNNSNSDKQKSAAHTQSTDTRSVRSNSTVNLEDYVDNEIPEKSDPSKLRPPSYTDRVLVHSLPDRKDRVTIQSYDSCDLIRVSDHRPIAMTLLLEVNANVFYKESAQSQTNVEQHALAQEPQFALYELLIADFSVTLVDLLYVEEDEDEEEEDDLVTSSNSKKNASISSDEVSILEDNPISSQTTGSGNSSTAMMTGNSESSSAVNTSVAARVGADSAVNPLHHSRSVLARSASSARPSSATTNTTTSTTAATAAATAASNDASGSTSSNTDDADTSSRPTSTNSNTSNKLLTKKSSGIRFADESVHVNIEEENSSGWHTPPAAPASPVSLSPPMSPDRNNSDGGSDVVAPKKKKKGGIKFVEADSDTMTASHTTTANNNSSSAYNEPSASSSNTQNSGGQQDIEMQSVSTKSETAGHHGHGSSSSNNNEPIIEVLAPPARPSLVPTTSSFNRGDLMKKSRSRSIFGSLSRQSTAGRRKSLFQTIFGGGDDDIAEESDAEELRKTESEDDLIKNMALQSMNWQGDTSGDWRRRVIEEEKERAKERDLQQNKLSLMKVVHANKKKKKKMNQHRIDQVTVVFPLPSKDPLLAYRRMYDYAKAFDMDDEDEQHRKKNNNKDYDIENQQEDVNSDEAARKALLKASSVFPWRQAPNNSNNNNNGGSNTGSSGNSSKKEAKFDSADRFQIRGCASQELGAHALIKVTTRTGTELGSSVICVTHLLHRDPTLIRSSFMKDIPLSSGGQKRGHIAGKFSLKFIPTALSAASGHNSSSSSHNSSSNSSHHSRGGHHTAASS